MNELPGVDLMRCVAHDVAYHPGFFRENLQSRIVRRGGLYVFCDFIGADRKFSFYEFSGRTSFKLRDSYAAYMHDIPTSHVWQRISGSIATEHARNKFATKSLEFISLIGEKEKWRIYCNNQPE